MHWSNMHSHCEWNVPMIDLRIIRMCAISFYPQVNDCRECFHWMTVQMNTYIHRILKIASFEFIYRRSLTYMCDMQYVQASIRHVSSSDEHYTLCKSIKSDTQHESHYPQSIKSTICCVFMIYHKSLLISFSLFSTYSLLLVFYLRLSLFDDRGYRLLNS
jgi:hypothetical protein